MKVNIFNSLSWTSGCALLLAVLQIFQIAILARILEPEAFGIVAVAQVIIGLCAILMDFGVSNAVIHKEKVTKIQLSTLFWLNYILGAFLCVVVYCSAPAVESFYNMTGLRVVIEVFSLNFLIAPLGTQSRVLLQKNFDFKAISIIDLVSAVANFLTTLWFALNSFGAISIVFGVLVQSTIANLLLFIRNKNRPLLAFDIKSCMFFIKFGLFQIGERLTNFLSSQIDVIIIGKTLGAEVTGVYSLLKQLVYKPFQLINPVINRVFFPYLSRLQNNLLKMKRAFTISLGAVSMLNTPIYIAICYFSLDLVSLYLGSSYSDYSFIVTYLSLSLLFMSYGNPIGTLQLAFGRADIGFYWNIAVLLMTASVVFFSASIDLKTVVVSLTILRVILIIGIWYFFVFPLIELGLKEYLDSLVYHISSNFVIITLTYLLTDALFKSGTERILFAFVISVFIWLVFTFKIDLVFKKLVQFRKDELG